jgi:hypothetical protein
MLGYAIRHHKEADRHVAQWTPQIDLAPRSGCSRYICTLLQRWSAPDAISASRWRQDNAQRELRVSGTGFEQVRRRARDDAGDDEIAVARRQGRRGGPDGLPL